MRAEVLPKVTCLTKLLLAHRALKRLLSCVSRGREVHSKVVFSTELHIALPALKWLFAGVVTEVRLKVVCSTELHVADRALKRLLPSVGTEVHCKRG